MISNSTAKKYNQENQDNGFKKDFKNYMSEWISPQFSAYQVHSQYCETITIIHF